MRGKGGPAGGFGGSISVIEAHAALRVLRWKSGGPYRPFVFRFADRPPGLHERAPRTVRTLRGAGLAPRERRRASARGLLPAACGQSRQRRQMPPARPGSGRPLVAIGRGHQPTRGPCPVRILFAPAQTARQPTAAPLRSASWSARGRRGFHAVPQRYRVGCPVLLPPSPSPSASKTPPFAARPGCGTDPRPGMGGHHRRRGRGHLDRHTRGAKQRRKAKEQPGAET